MRLRTVITLNLLGLTDLNKQCIPRSDAASDQGLHCLPVVQHYISDTSTNSKAKNKVIRFSDTFLKK